MSTALTSLQTQLCNGNIESYIEWANKIPALSASEEIALVEKMNNENDMNAAKQLVLHHLRFVIHIARGYNGYGLPLADLIQEGNIGLMKAVKKFNPTKGVRLMTYAVHWIKSEILEYVIKNLKIATIATTAAQRKLFYNLKKYLSQNKSLTQDQIEEITNKLNVSKKDVITMEQRLGYDVSFDNTGNDDGDNDMPALNAPANNLTDPNIIDQAHFIEHNDWQQHRQELFNNAMSTLDDREKTIIKKRWLTEKKATLHDLAASLNISKERVRQLEAATIKKLQKLVAA